MSKLFVEELKPYQEIQCRLLLVEMERREAKNGKSYLNLQLADKTGRVTGRIWEDADRYHSQLVVGEVVWVKAKTDMFREQLQLNVQEIAVVPRDEVDYGDYLPTCPIEVDCLMEELKSVMGSIRNAQMRRFFARLSADTHIMSAFKQAPAAKGFHHAYLGGLLEHTVSVAKLCSGLNEHYRHLQLNRDLLVAGAIVHDIGKIRELSWDLAIGYTDEGRLIGHIVLGWQIVEDLIRDIKGFPKQNALLLKHLILSHHGIPEFDTVRLPMTREAFMLHYADDLDAKMNNLTQILDAEADQPSHWTSFQRIYNRFLFKGWQKEEKNGENRRDNDGAGVGRFGLGKQLSLWDSAHCVAGSTKKEPVR